MKSKRMAYQHVKVVKTLSGMKLEKPYFIEKYIPQHNHGNPRPRHFNARFAGWVPGENKKGKPCKMWVKTRKPKNARTKKTR